MESPTIIASCSVSQRGTKRLRMEISKTRGGEGGEVIVSGLDRFFRCCTQGLWFPGTGVKDIWKDRVPGARGLCRETHGVEVVGVLASVLHTYPGLVGVSPGCFQHCSMLPQLGLLPKQLVDMPLHCIQLQRMQLERVLTCTQR